MGILERKWLIDNCDMIFRELEYHRDHSAVFSTDRSFLWRIKDDEGRMKIETRR